MEHMFKDVLKKGEVIVKIYKPDKVRFWWGWLLATFFSLVWILSGIIIPLGFPGGGTATQFLIATLVSVGVFAVSFALCVVAGVLWYKNRFHAFTDKRVLIRGGIIGIDYKSLDFKSLTATVVKVGVLDKILRRNTGSIKFGSAASPILSFSSSTGHSNQYIFFHIVNPYQDLRDITEYMDQKAAETEKKGE